VVRDVRVGDKDLKPGQGVLLIWASANRDEREFPDADRFDIHRRYERSLLFGHGQHKCIGEHIGMKMGTVMLEELLRSIVAFDVDARTSLAVAASLWLQPMLAETIRQSGIGRGGAPMGYRGPGAGVQPVIDDRHRRWSRLTIEEKVAPRRRTSGRCAVPRLASRRVRPTPNAPGRHLASAPPSVHPVRSARALRERQPAATGSPGRARPRLPVLLAPTVNLPVAARGRTEATRGSCWREARAAYCAASADPSSPP
jgi:hypothetical protein